MYFTTSSYSTNHSSRGLLSTSSEFESSLLSSNNQETGSILSNVNAEFDTGSIGGKDILFGNPDLSDMGSTFFAAAPQTETAGSIAFNSAETAGSIAFGGTETAGSVACSGSSAGASVGGDSGCGGGGGFSSFC